MKARIAPTLHTHVIGGHDAYPDDEEYARACRELRALLAVARAARVSLESAYPDYAIPDGIGADLTPGGPDAVLARALSRLDAVSRGGRAASARRGR